VSESGDVALPSSIAVAGADLVEERGALARVVRERFTSELQEPLRLGRHGLPASIAA